MSVTSWCGVPWNSANWSRGERESATSRQLLLNIGPSTEFIILYYQQNVQCHHVVVLRMEAKSFSLDFPCFQMIISDGIPGAPRFDARLISQSLKTRLGVLPSKTLQTPKASIELRDLRLDASRTKISRDTSGKSLLPAGPPEDCQSTRYPFCRA